MSFTVLFSFLKMQVHDKAERIGCGLLQLGIKPGSENFICILCSNRPEVRSIFKTFINKNVQVTVLKIQGL